MRLIVRWCVGCLIAIFVLASPAAAAPIHDAAKKGDVPAITAALEAGADVNESDGLATALWYAARRGHEDAAKLLIARGADVNLTTKSSGPPLLGAIERRNGILVKLLLASGANPNGLIGGSGRPGQKHRIAELMDGLAPHYGDDFWFMAYHAMALSEDGRLAAARAKIERSVSINPNNAHGAHGYAHVCYESGEPDTARAYLGPWLATYPRDGFFYGHLSWHLSLCEIQAGNWEVALRLYQDALTIDRHSGGPQQKISDGAAFLWRSELAGHPRDAAAWRGLYDYADSALARPGSGLADLHVMLAQAVIGDKAGLDTRARQMEELAREGRYP